MSTALRRIERLLFTVAVLCLAYVAATVVEAEYYRAAAHAIVATEPPARAVDERPVIAGSEARAPDPASPRRDEGPPSARPKARPASGPAIALIGELAIPHLKISTAILEGDNWQALRRGAGHMPGTPLPGEPGNMVLAGHRDTVFRRLAEIHRGDRLRVTTTHGTFNYRVSRTLRVKPRDVWVLDEDAAALTLVTCYPFNWVGSAPERWIVQAERETADGID